MVPFSKQLSLTCGAGLVLLAAACGGGEGPTASTPVKLSSPEAIPAQLQAVSTSFNSQFYQSFASMSGAFQTAAPALTQAAALVQATRPTVPLETASRLSRLRSVVDVQATLSLKPLLMSRVTTATIFPPEVSGKTYVWDPSTLGYVVSDRLGAPLTGVRFILYAIDVLTYQPDVSKEIGYADLTDVSPSLSTTKLRIQVVGTTPSPATYLDYTVSVTATTTAETISATGFVTDGTTRLDFAGTVIATLSGTTLTGLTIDVAYDVNAQDAHLRLILGLSETSLTLNFTFRHAGEVITLTATFTDTGSATITVKVNGATFATCEADVNGLAGDCQGASGPLTDAEQAALQALSGAFFSDEPFGTFFDLMDLGLHLMGYGGL